MNAIFIVLPILTLLMFDLGLTLKPQDFKLIVQRPKPVIVGLVGQIILLPLIAWGIIQLSAISHPLSALFVIGIMLVACSPGGSSSNVFSMLAKGDVALSVTLTACSSLITLFTLPLIMAWVTASVGEATDIRLPIGNLVIQNIVLMVVPISIGFVVNIFREQTAAKIHNILKRPVSDGLFLSAQTDHCGRVRIVGSHYDYTDIGNYRLRSVARMAPTADHQRKAHTRHRDRHAECRTSYYYRVQPTHLQQRDHRYSCHHLCPNDEPHSAGIRWYYQNTETMKRW